MYLCSQERMEDKIGTFAHMGDDGNGGITRYSLSREALEARAEFVRRMKKTGAVIRTDDLANLYATLPGTEKTKEIVMGSHIDSVKNGGNYDGILGVISAMEVLETVADQGIPHRHPLTAMIWTNEEGSLYPPVMMCSGIVCHDFLPGDIQPGYRYEDMMRSVSREDGRTTFGERLSASGYAGAKENRISPDNALCLFETHIEQGPLLEDDGMELGVVDCVLGMYHYRLRFYGQTTHAGTFPMQKRKDAFYAAAEALCELHREMDALGIPDLVYTTGEIQCHPNMNTCVPDFFEFSFDVRHEEASQLEKVSNILLPFAEREWHGCRCEIERKWKRDTVYWNGKLSAYIKRAAEEMNVRHRWIHSGAGHDAQFAAYMLPAAMIFAPSRGGLSHCEQEYTPPEQCTLAASVMLNAVLAADSEFEEN